MRSQTVIRPTCALPVNTWGVLRENRANCRLPLLCHRRRKTCAHGKSVLLDNGDIQRVVHPDPPASSQVVNYCCHRIDAEQDEPCDQRPPCKHACLGSRQVVQISAISNRGIRRRGISSSLEDTMLAGSSDLITIFCPFE